MEFYVLYPKRIMYIRSRGVGSIHEQIGRKKNRVTLHAFIQDFKLKSLIKTLTVTLLGVFAVYEEMFH